MAYQTLCRYYYTFLVRNQIRGLNFGQWAVYHNAECERYLRGRSISEYNEVILELCPQY